jgi:hypothetical protein
MNKVVYFLNEHYEALVKPLEHGFWDKPMLCNKLEDFHEKFFEERKIV